MRQLLEVDLDRLDRLGGCGLAFGRHGKNRLTDEQHLVLGQDRRLRRRELRHVICGQDAEHSRHFHGRRGIDAADARVGDRACERFAECHALGPKILGIFGPAGDLRHDVDGGKIFSDQLVSHFKPPAPRA